MENKEMIELLKETESLMEGHFLLSSGNHSNRYCQCAKLLQYPDKAEKAIKIITDQLTYVPCDVVVGPAMGGILVAYELSRQLGVKNVFTERENDVMTLRRGFTLNKGDKVLIAEDVITTGKSTLETIEALKPYGVEIVGLACLVDRRPATQEPLGYPVFSATQLAVEIYKPDSCPLCEEELPLVKPGSRKKF